MSSTSKRVLRRQVFAAWAVWSLLFVPVLVGLLTFLGGVYVATLGPSAVTWWGGLGLLLFLSVAVVFFAASLFLPIGSSLELWVRMSHRRARQPAKGEVVSQ